MNLDMINCVILCILGDKKFLAMPFSGQIV